MTGANRTQGETVGQEQEPTEAGEDPAKRAPQPDGPMVQPIDPAEASDEGADPDRAARGAGSPSG
jgi:hypothetical protein